MFEIISLCRRAWLRASSIRPPKKTACLSKRAVQGWLLSFDGWGEIHVTDTYHEGSVSYEWSVGTSFWEYEKV